MVAIAVPTHIHHSAARGWWDQDDSDQIGFCRLTQLGLLRLLTTASAMGGVPLTNADAWKVYDAFCEDGRVLMLPELPAIDALFRGHSDAPRPSPKIWSDCYLAAYASASKATLITFDLGFSKYDVASKILQMK